MHNKQLYSSSYDKTIRVWDIQTLSCTRTLTSPQRPEVRFVVQSAHYPLFAGVVQCACVWQDLVFVGVEEDGKIRVYDASGECVQTLREHGAAVLSIVANEDLVISSSYEGSKSTKVWGILDNTAE